MVSDTAPPSELLVRRVTLEAEAVISIDLEHPSGGELPGWEPGAHIDLWTPSGLIRQFSLCGDPDDHYRYRIAVLRELRSRGGSRELHERPLVGRMLRFLGPRNHFLLEPADRYLFLAGGIGITPLLPMVLAAEQRNNPWELVYGGRRRTAMAFCEELSGRRGGVLELLPEDERGRPELDAILGAVGDATLIYCCGPEEMLAAVEERCQQLSLSQLLHVERFSVASTPSTATLGTPSNGAFEVELARSGKVITVPPDKTLLRAVREVVPTVLYSCEEGYCGTCETRVLDGEPEHRDSILSTAEQATNTTMMICVGRSRSRRLVLDL